MSSKLSKSNLVLFLVAITLPLMSCKNIVNNGDFDVVLIPKNVLAIPSKAKDCDGTTELGAAYVIFPTFKYTWLGTNPLQIEMVSVRFQSSYIKSTGGVYSKVIAGTDLLAALGTASSRPPTGVEQIADCGIRAGGIEFNSGVNYASVSGYVKILATEVLADGSLNPVTAEIPVSFSYEKF